MAATAEQLSMGMAQTSAPDKPPRRWPWLALAAALVAVAALWSMYAWLSNPQRFPLETVQLRGELQHTSEQELRQALSPWVGRGMWGMDVQGIRKSVETLPWVWRASVRRIWPGTLVVHVQEHQPMAYWNGGGLVTEGGLVFQPESASLPKGLPSLQGPDGFAARMVRRYAALKPVLAGSGFELTGLRLDERLSWFAEVDGSVEIAIGRDHFDMRIERFLTAWAGIREQAPGPMASADLRYPNGFAIAWRDQEIRTEHE